MGDWKELFPVEGIAPFIGGIIVWFGINYLYLAPEIIAPRLAAKYYMPACQAVVAEGRRERQAAVASMKETGERQIQDTMRSVAQQAQQATGGMIQQLFGGRPGSAEFMQRHGDTVQNWASGYLAPALQQRLNQERAALTQRLQAEEREARKGIIHNTPSQFCGCAISDGLKDRIDLAAFTASLRLYTPAAVRRLESGAIVTEAGPCGKPPIV